MDREAWLAQLAEHTNVDAEPPRKLPTRTVQWDEVRPVEWLWDQRVPIGKLSLLVGVEGTGKGTFLSHLIARCIRGELDGDRHGIPQAVLLVGDEDGFEDVWVPRIYAAGASATEIEKHVHLVDSDFNLIQDSDALANAMIDVGAGWVIMDQVLDHIDLGRDGALTYNAAAIRKALQPLRAAAKKAGAAATGNLHPVKGTPKTFRDLIGGSHQFNAVSRSSLWLGVDPDGAEDQRVVVRGKGNHGAEPPCIEFRIAGHTFDLAEQFFEEPRVQDMREGTRRKADFEGGQGFARGTTHSVEDDARLLYEHLDGRSTNAYSKDDDIGLSRERAGEALSWLERHGAAKDRKKDEKTNATSWVKDGPLPNPPPLD